MEQQNISFQDKYGPWALVTGASDGIGAAIATLLATRGLNLVLVARRTEKLQSVASTVQKEFRVETRAVTADLGSRAGVKVALNAAEDLEIGLFAGCAGFGTAGQFVTASIEEETNLIDLNCRSLIELTHPLARSMRHRRRGGIILMSSIVAFQGVANSATYAASKAFVQSFAEGLGNELAPFNVDVLASAPAQVHTGFAARADMQMSGGANPDTVASDTVNALGRRRTIRPGARAKILGLGLATLPRPLKSRILGQVIAGTTKHRHATKETEKP